MLGSGKHDSGFFVFVVFFSPSFLHFFLFPCLNTCLTLSLNFGKNKMTSFS